MYIHFACWLFVFTGALDKGLCRFYDIAISKKRLKRKTNLCHSKHSEFLAYLFGNFKCFS